MSTLYQLTEAYQELLSMALDPDTDPEALADTMEAIDGEFEDKVESYIITIEDVKANAAILEAEEKRLAARRKAFKRNADRMISVVESAMRATGKKKIKTKLYTLGIQKNPPALKIDLPDRVPEEFLIPQEPKVDTAAIKKELKEGVVYDWCHLEQSEGLRIR